jgi:hypothetical protein
MTLYKYLHNLLNVLVQAASKMGLQQNMPEVVFPQQPIRNFIGTRFGEECQ